MQPSQGVILFSTLAHPKSIWGLSGLGHAGGNPNMSAVPAKATCLQRAIAVLFSGTFHPFHTRSVLLNNFGI